MGRGAHFLAIILVLLFFSLACKTDKHTAELEFNYYPDKNVYYDPLKKEFLYSLDGAKSWSKFADSNITESTTMGEKVVVFSKNATVYKDNENHRKLYAGRLYNISLGDTSAATVGPEAVERKVEQKRRQVPVKKTVSRKNENNIGRFFNKIFGKHR